MNHFEFKIYFSNFRCLRVRKLDLGCARPSAEWALKLPVMAHFRALREVGILPRVAVAKISVLPSPKLSQADQNLARKRKHN